MMFNDHIHAALARERSGTLLAGAEAARRGRQARAGQPEPGAPPGNPVVLRDGSGVLIRPVQQHRRPAAG